MPGHLESSDEGTQFGEKSDLLSHRVTITRYSFLWPFCTLVCVRASVCHIVCGVQWVRPHAEQCRGFLDTRQIPPAWTLHRLSVVSCRCFATLSRYPLRHASAVKPLSNFANITRLKRGQRKTNRCLLWSQAACGQVHASGENLHTRKTRS